MKSAFTLNDLILFAFNDTLDADEDYCSPKSNNTSSVAAKWKCIFECDPWKNQIGFSPLNASVGQLLAYSRSLQVFNTKCAGTVFKLLN